MSTHPYSESQIIALITEYYHLLFSLNYLLPKDIDFPPPVGREIDQTLCQSLNLTPEVISLMQHIPCPCSEGLMLEHELLIPQSHANSFVDAKLVKLGRDPEVGENEWFLKGTDIALSVMGDEGQYLVLDTEKNTLRVCTWDGPNGSEDEDEPGLEYDSHPNSPDDHYTRFPVHDPVEYLQSIIDKTRSLEWLPMRLHSMGSILTAGLIYSETKRILIEEYGWPDNFKSEEWKRDRKRITKEILEHQRKLDEEEIARRKSELEDSNILSLCALQ